MFDFFSQDSWMLREEDRGWEEGMKRKGGGGEEGQEKIFFFLIIKK